jgi:hypothetical protein
MFSEEEKHMSKRNNLKKAVVLLFAALMVFSSEAVIANTNNHEVNNTTEMTTPVNPSSAPLTRDLIWDNVVDVHGSLGGIIVATVRTEGTAFPVDDFMLNESAEVTSLFWQGGYFQCQLASGQIDYHWDWRVLFWTDEGTGNHPGNEIYNQTIPDASITREHWYDYTHPTNGNTYWVANYSMDLPVPITFNANTKYWITIQAIQDGNTYPQGCWSRHNNSVGGIKLHEAEIKAAYWGYPDWTNISVLVTDQLPHDLNFQLFSGTVQDTIPPVTTCTLNGTMQGGVYITDVTATLTATDVGSGVNYTKYKVDSGAWALYTAPFIVKGNGQHTIYFYSVDKAGNIETEKNTTFTIRYPILITIKGGLGITATIKNNGTVAMTNLSWSITLDGKFIFVGKSKTGTITTLDAGKETKVRDFVFGFGKTNIAVSVGGTEATATGTVILFFVLGVT